MQEFFFELIFIATADDTLLGAYEIFCFFSKSNEIIKIRSESHELIEIILVQCTQSKSIVYIDF